MSNIQTAAIVAALIVGGLLAGGHGVKADFTSGGPMIDGGASPVAWYFDSGDRLWFCKPDTTPSCNRASFANNN